MKTISLIITICIIAVLTGGTASRLSALEGINKMLLDNGMKVIMIEDHSQPLVSVQVWVKAGSVNENRKTAGLSHFLEHLIFKGSKKYPGDAMTRITETRGGSINASTSKEFTQFHIDIQKETSDEAIKMLADAMNNAAFPAAEIEKERPVVLEEIRRHEDSPDSVLYEMLNEALFLKTTYRSSIIGSSDVIKNVTRNEIESYYKKYYVPENMAVSIAGDFNPETTLALIKDTFGKQKSIKAPLDPNLREEIHKAVEVRNTKDVEHVYWMGAFLGPDIRSDEQFTADITAIILGGARSSRLFQNLREKKKLVFSISSSFWSQRGTGMFVIQSFYKPENEQEVLKQVNFETQLLMDKGPSDEELKRAKAILKSQWYFGRETIHDRAALSGYWESQGNPEMLNRYIPGIENITGDDVKAFLNKYYASQGLNQAILIPGK